MFTDPHMDLTLIDKDIISEWMTSNKTLEEWSEIFRLATSKDTNQIHPESTTKLDLKVEKSLFHKKLSHQTPAKRKLEKIINDQEIEAERGYHRNKFDENHCTDMFHHYSRFVLRHFHCDSNNDV